MKNLDLHITSMPASRPADYYLSCLDGCVFIDFNDVDERICLVRISFDSYGCCDLEGNKIPLNEEDSIIFKKNMKSKKLNQKIMAIIVKKAISLNKALIWEEALSRYQLI